MVTWVDLADHVPRVAFLSELLFYYFENTVKSKCTKKKKEKDQRSGGEHSGSQQENPEQLCNPGFSLSSGAEACVCPARYSHSCSFPCVSVVLSGRVCGIPTGKEEKHRMATKKKPKNKNQEVRS